MAKTGKRMYCPECKKNRTWMSAYKKQQMEPGEKPYDFRFFVCQTCEYAHDPKTGLEISEWRERYYSAEDFEEKRPVDIYYEYAGPLDYGDGDFFAWKYGMINFLINFGRAGIPMSKAPNKFKEPLIAKQLTHVSLGFSPNRENWTTILVFDGLDRFPNNQFIQDWVEWLVGEEVMRVPQTEGEEVMEFVRVIEDDHDYFYNHEIDLDFIDPLPSKNSNELEADITLTMANGDLWKAFPVKFNKEAESFIDSFRAVVVQQRKPKGIIDKVLMQQDMMMRAQLQELTMRLDTDVRLGIISEEQADMIMMKNLMNMGLLPDDFEAEDWDDVDWTDPPSEVPRGLDSTWGEDVEWNDDNQAEKALDYFMDLAEGSAATELESRFILSPRHFAQFTARLGSEQREYIDTIEGFGEGPYPVALNILTPAEIVAQTELQLHTIFEAFETVLEGAPDEHDHDDDDHDDHDHDEFETILKDYYPYRPERYRVHVRTAEGVKMMGEYTNLTAAQELADDWNAPGYGKPLARIERVRARNGAFRGLSRVVFDDGSYLTFVLMGDLTHRDSEFVDMTSFFVFPSTFDADNNWWESQRNN